MANSSEIKIKRNIVERGLMLVLDFVKSNRKLVLYSSVGLVLAICLVTGILVHVNNVAKKDLAEFETILDEYRQSYAENEHNRKEKLESTVAKLEDVVESSYWGYVHENGYYVIGTLYFNEEMYSEAREYFTRFAENSSSFFTPLAYQQAAICSEHLGEFKKALNIYSTLEKEYDDSYLMDQVYYNLGRMYQVEKELFKAREYYKKVISQYPQSFFAENAKSRLLLLGAIEKTPE